MNKNIWIATVAVLVIAVGGYVFPKVLPPYGAAGPDFQVECLTFNGVKKCYNSIPMTKATSTPCVQYVTATSTLDSFSFTVSSSTSVTATTYTLATSTVRNATTSIITYFGTASTSPALSTGGYADSSGTTTVPAGAQVTLSWYGGTKQAGLISPRTYLTLGVQGGTGNFGTAAQVGGVCKSVLTEVGL